MQINIDYKKLEEVCLAPESTWLQGNSYYYKDNGSNILAVAHLDYVCHGLPDFVHYKYKGQTYIQSETLDDRLGVYVILYILPQLGVNVDVLLTTDEEIGASTAQFFEPTKKYNWMFSFDRRNTGVVAYDYEDDALEELVQQATGSKFEFGSYSDIVYLDHLHIKGLNFGVGYVNEHTESCWASERNVMMGVKNFLSFWNRNKDNELAHTSTVKRRGSVAVYSGGRYGQGYGSRSTTWEHGYEDEDGEYITDGYCPYCNQWGKLVFSGTLQEDMCEDCYYAVKTAVKKEIDLHNNLDTDLHCQLCSITDKDEPVDIHTITVPHTGQVVTVCEYCEDSIKDHDQSDANYFKHLRFDY